MSEYISLIQKEKKEALQNYDEVAFRLQLNQKIAVGTKPSRSYVTWFQKPAIAGSTVLLVLFFGWLTTQIFLSVPQESDIVLLRNTFAQLFNQHDTILDQIPLPIDVDSDKPAIHEFEWSLKRVILAIQRENVPDKDIAQNLTLVLQNVAVLIKSEKVKSGEFNI